jgi:hypothetical protein
MHGITVKTLGVESNTLKLLTICEGTITTGKSFGVWWNTLCDKVRHSEVWLRELCVPSAKMNRWAPLIYKRSIAICFTLWETHHTERHNVPTLFGLTKCGKSLSDEVKKKRFKPSAFLLQPHHSVIWRRDSLQITYLSHLRAICSVATWP